MKKPINALRWLSMAALLAAAASAHAVPSFSRQTGMDCVSCHIGGFGPQLTPAGIKFKLGGYTDSDGKAGKIPLSAMLIASYKKDGEIKKTSLDEASIFLAGRMTDKIGAFVQVTHDGESHQNSLDTMDLRYADTFQVQGHEALVGVSINNKPMAQDPFNTFGWSFPYTGAEIGVDVMGMAKTEGRALGTSVYTLINESIYGEVGMYNTLSPSFQSKLGQGKQDAIDAGSLTGAPYVRLGYFQDMKTQAWSVGMLGFSGKLKDRASGETANRFNDFGLDASYQFLGNREHIVTVNGSYIRERNTATNLEEGTSEGLKTTLSKVAASYHYMNTYGATAALVSGKTKDPEGVITSQQSGYILQADWTPWGKESSWYAPWANVRVGLQYAGFNKFVEDGVKLDTPHDKNRTTLFVWAAY
jgi:hypothetical protein